MRQLIARPVIAIAATLAVFTVGASASTSHTLAWSGSAAGGSWSITTGTSFSSGSQYSLTAMSDILFTTLLVDGTTSYNVTNNQAGNCAGTANTTGGVLDLSGNTLTLYGAVTGLTGISSGCNPLATLTGSFKGTWQSGTFGTFNFTGLSGMGDSSTLLGDLGFAGDAPTSLGPSPSIAGISGSNTSPTNTYQADSNMFTQNVSATPEPFSFLLAGSGLAIVLMLSRRRKSNDPCPAGAQSRQ